MTTDYRESPQNAEVVSLGLKNMNNRRLNESRVNNGDSLEFNPVFKRKTK
jgi:hypothetical protein